MQALKSGGEENVLRSSLRVSSGEDGGNEDGGKDVVAYWSLGGVGEGVGTTQLVTVHATEKKVLLALSEWLGVEATAEMCDPDPRRHDVDHVRAWNKKARAALLQQVQDPCPHRQPACAPAGARADRHTSFGRCGLDMHAGSKRFIRLPRQSVQRHWST